MDVMPNPKISVIIAAYNTAEYLPLCLDSLLAQSLTDWEAVCVDDGSTDLTLEVLNRYAADDKRIRVIHSAQNQGAAKARNIALAQCTGRYICFLDSDDWFSVDALESVVRMFSDYPLTDSVLFQCRYVYPDGSDSTYDLPPFDSLSGREAFRRTLFWELHGVYAVRAGIHKRYQYDESARWFSDDNTTLYHYLASREVRQCEGVYNYRQRESSVSHSVSIRRFDILDSMDSLRRNVQAMGVGDEEMALVEKKRWLNVVDCYMYYYVNRSAFTAEERTFALDRLRKAWSTADCRRLPSALKRKFGYIPFGRHWTLFRIQEEAYFFLRSLLCRN